LKKIQSLYTGGLNNKGQIRIRGQRTMAGAIRQHGFRSDTCYWSMRKHRYMMPIASLQNKGADGIIRQGRQIQGKSIRR